MFVTPNMGLSSWDLGTDPYDHAQLSNNFKTIDDHDHTPGPPHRGKQIPSAGILDGAVTTAKIAGNAVIPTSHIPVDSIPQSRLADNSVGPGELQDGAVDTAAIANGAVTIDKLDGTVVPLGTVVLWYRADSAVLPPSGWEVMDGRAWSGIVNKLGAGGVQWNTGNIPNMANKFPLGAALAGTDGTPANPPAIGAVGGQHTRNISHGHTAQPHSHTVNAHSHPIALGGGHRHTFDITTPGGPGVAALFSRDVGVPKSDGSRQALYLPGHNSGNFAGADVAAPMTLVADHSHGGVTGDAGAGTDSPTITINDWSSGALDFRPAHIGLLFIMRVR